MPINIHVLQHVFFEGLGSIEDWLTTRAARVDWTRFYAGDPLPDPAGIDLLIILGGPMSVNDEADHPWLTAEKRFVAAAIAGGTPVLGICLGAQLIASALGARVYPGPQKEIGWFSITASDSTPGRFAFPPETTAFHWHGETFDLPPGAVRLASSAAVTNQAFQVGDRVIGLQFHLETTPASLAAIAEHCADEITDGPTIQSAATMQQAPPETFAAINALMAAVLDYLIR